MPKAFRKCSLCPNNSYVNEDIVIFTVNNDRFVCEEHYRTEDIRLHGISKRFVDIIELKYWFCRLAVAIYG